MHGAGDKAIIMRRPDGSPMTRQEVIVMRRGAMKWLPVLCSNDLVHGSWWFVWGSVATVIFSIYPLVQQYIDPWKQQDDIMPVVDYEIIWSMLIISGFFFMIGSYAFVHGFEEPPQIALFYNFRHFQTDELFASWMFLFGMIPFIPYMLVQFTVNPSAFYFFGLIGAIVFVLASALMVAACYPSKNSSKEPVNYSLPFFTFIFGAQMWVVKHLVNDWLAGMWIFFWGNALLVFVSFILLLIALGLQSDRDIFIWSSGTICSFLYLVGSAYFVAGSYPHAFQFYYTTDRGQANASQSQPSEVFADELGLVNNSYSHNGGTSVRQIKSQVKTAIGTAAEAVVSPFHNAAAGDSEAVRLHRKLHQGEKKRCGVPKGGSLSGSNRLMGKTIVSPMHSKISGTAGVILKPAPAPKPLYRDISELTQEEEVEDREPEDDDTQEQQSLSGDDITQQIQAKFESTTVVSKSNSMVPNPESKQAEDIAKKGSSSTVVPRDPSYGSLVTVSLV